MNYEKVESIRQRSSMSKQIVTQRDAEYAYYAGASLEIANQMADIDFYLKLGLFPKPMETILKVFRSNLNQKRKAFFASVGCTEISKLGFILGNIHGRKDAGIGFTQEE